ncbi:Acyltransferase family protein [Brevibacterium sandarakinum]|uniref:Acyltransferase family protein n=1 Tax=Brevibacterium sandarakinum TaxID=629680 RepID=A0A1H1TH34_BRESA|nr:acyltransferase [Brevibacterium sandarakinum]SDS59530.1 Acyltransferase family protein [Brevibacterium sandarakinum]
MSLTFAGSSEAPGVPEVPSAPEASGRSANRAAVNLPHRDGAIDLIRFGCLVVVVILHSLMSGAVLGADGEVVPTVALSGTVGFTVASWLYQIMPLFFFIGGYAAINGWRRTQATGGTWADYIRARLRRLVIPVAVLIGVAGVGLSIASEIGVPTGLLAEASTRIGQPLWFLAVDVGLTSLVPLAVHFHERAPRRSIAVLAGAVIAVDAVVALTGVTGLGYLNFLFVWPLIQQCGFFYADAIHRPVRVGFAWTTMVLALVALGVLVGVGVYSPNMLVNLNPPTGALVLLGVAQMCILRLSHARLNEIVSGRRAGTERAREYRARIWQRVITWGNTYGIQVYLWHMPIVITLIGILGFGANLVAGASFGDGVPAAGILLPEIESAWWWLTRLSWLLTVMVLAGASAMAMSKVPFPGEERLARAWQAVGRVAREIVGEIAGHRESRPAGETRVGSGVQQLGEHLSSPAGRAIIAVTSAMSGIAIALLVGIAPLFWALVSVAALMSSLVLAAGLKARVPESAAVPEPAAVPESLSA